MAKYNICCSDNAFQEDASQEDLVVHFTGVLQDFTEAPLTVTKVEFDGTGQWMIPNEDGNLPPQDLYWHIEVEGTEEAVKQFIRDWFLGATSEEEYLALEEDIYQ